MADLLTIENLGNLLMLCFLQAVLGFDNLLYISIESQRAPVAQQRAVRFWGIIIAVALRVVLLFVMISLIDKLAEPFVVLNWVGILEGGVNFATCVFILGGVFIIYTAVKEISHMLSVEHLHTDVEGKSGKSAAKVVMLIVFMNLIFSFDSVLSALAITDVFAVLAIAIILSGVAMLVLADSVTRFLEKNRMYEVLGLFILLIVGVVLLGEAGQAAAHAMHDDALALKFFGYEVVPMSKTTFYFSVIVLFAVEIIQSGYTRKLNAERRAQQGGARH
ncbi:MULTISPECIES: tellurium resistance protein TerC [Roseovarius]|uniref:Tellurium resistance protein TerC n=1 Tax=Roseovarius nubinhibens TaxID=314263 RepID=A0A348WDC9_9RHOB|nr:tellurium resistance protein TerC [Roseovarius sp.]MAZ21581.1 tellurium resistance protein TerC [Roseovarius sp.]HAR52541.1 tellurium resistance protein TerC [Roseovarius nubinhibens]|tara:strand:+ start:1762 stop:2589 length:828 start_codon:yes stop_codon:yes gene_type:complete